MLYVLAVLCIALMLASVFLNILSLPGNWLALIFLVLWAVFAPGGQVGAPFVGVLVALALAGEVAEFYLQARQAKLGGSSSKGNLGGMIGAFAGAILGAPFFFGLGALPGALAGAYAGALITELALGRKGAEARRAAWGAMTGKFAGFLLKFSLGLGIVGASAPHVWP